MFLQVEICVCNTPCLHLSPNSIQAMCCQHPKASTSCSDTDAFYKRKKKLKRKKREIRDLLKRLLIPVRMVILGDPVVHVPTELTQPAAGLPETWNGSCLSFAGVDSSGCTQRVTEKCKCVLFRKLPW